MRSSGAQALKRWAGPWAAPLLLALARLSARRRGVAVLYHEAIDDDAPTRVVPTVTRDVLQRQLRHLRRHYELVAAEDLPAAVAARRRGRRYPAAVTFDDDAVEHVQHALPELRAAGVPATFFLSGTFLGGDDYWWRDLRRARAAGHNPARLLPGADPAEPTAALEARIRDLQPSERATLAAGLRALAGPAPAGSRMTRDHVHALLAAGQRIGFHTRDHHPLRGLGDAELQAALHDGRAALEAVVGGPLDMIAYPHGSADERVAAAARAAGYRLGFTAARGAVTPDGDPLRLGRVDGAQRSRGAFAVGLLLGLRAR